MESARATSEQFPPPLPYSSDRFDVTSPTVPGARNPMPLNCPSEAELLLLAVADDNLPSAGVGRHVAGCESCQARVADLRRLVLGIRASSTGARSGTGACLDELDVAALVEGSGDL